MGVIFRNGIPYGATESDVTTVYEKADLYDLTDKRENHLYIVEEENKPYRYDLETDEFYPIGASDTPPIVASKYQVLIGDGNNWATHNNWYAQYNPTANESALYARDADTIILGGGTVPEREDAPPNYDGWLIPDGPFLKVQGNSRLNVSEGAWADITGEGTALKVNSGSKVFLDSYYGANNLYMHGGFITINDAKEPSYSRPQITYYVLKSDYPDKPEADLQWFDENGAISQVQKSFSTHYPYIENETVIINSMTSINALINIGYSYVCNSVYSGWAYVDGEYKQAWTIRIDCEKIAPEAYEDRITGSKPFCYDWDDDWPAESENVPRINISGAPRMNFTDYSYVSIQKGGIVEIVDSAQIRLHKNTHMFLSSSHLVMQSGESAGPGTSTTPIHPYITLVDEESADRHNLSLGFTTVKPANDNSGCNPSGSPIKSDLLTTPSGTKCDFNFVAGDIGPYSNFHRVQLTVSGDDVYKTWLNQYVDGNSSNPYRKNLLPLLHRGGPVYEQISVDGGSLYVHNPQIGYGSVYEILPELKNGSKAIINPCMDGSCEFMAKFGGYSGARTHIQYMPKSCDTSILVDTESGCNTYFHDNRAGGTTLGVHIGSISGSNLLFTLTGGMGNGAIYDQTIIGYSGRPGTIQKLIEGIDTFELESGQMHKEMRDDARFIMRGENYPSLNSPGTSYQNDISQGKWDSGFARFSKNTCHLNKYWDRPINNEDFKKSPTFQMYECSNLILRGFWKYPERSVTIPTTAYSHLTEATPISLTELKSHTTEWEYFLGCFDSDEEFIGLVPESQIIATPTSIVVQRANFQFTGDNSYVKKYHPNAGLDTFKNRSSLLEITDNSELRLWDGICIYGRYDPQTNEPGIEIVNRYGTNGTDMNETNVETGDNKEPLDRISFTFTELKQLKALLTQIPIQVVQSASEATEPGIMYFVDGGGN